jgi:predicted DsbA family dithiol-disulfide isomerase
MRDTVNISYFTDMLCVWAYVAQIRLDELQRQHGSEIEVRYRFVPIFGSTAHRVGESWKHRGGFDGYAAHVAEVCDGFDHVQLNPDAWTRVRPASSGVSHQFVKAIQVLEEEGEISAEPDERFDAKSRFEEFVWRARLAFFRDGRDISRIDVLLDLAVGLDLPADQIERRLDDGRAMAAMCRDSQLGDELKVDGSPTYVLNQGRQKLYGNVGYKIIEANVEEILRRPDDAASWC